MSPESKFKAKVDRLFDRVFSDHKSSYHTSIEKGRGQKSGLPDRFYSAARAHAWVESKVAPFRLSPLQEVVLGRLARSGSRVVVLTLLRDDTIKLQQWAADGTPCEPSIHVWDDLKQEDWWLMLLGKESRCVPCGS